MRCEAKNCPHRDAQEVQFILVRNKKHPMEEKHKEWYCPTHLRQRVFELELMKLAGKLRKEVLGSH